LKLHHDFGAHCRSISSGSDQIPAELKAGGETLWSEFHKLINYIGNKDVLPYQWKGPPTPQKQGTRKNSNFLFYLEGAAVG
jgi:hypothetical protein